MLARKSGTSTRLVSQRRSVVQQQMFYSWELASRYCRLAGTGERFLQAWGAAICTLLELLW